MYVMIPEDKIFIDANTSIFTVLLRRLSLRTNHNSPMQAQTDDLFSGYARKTVKIFLLFAPLGRFPFGIYIFYMIYRIEQEAHLFSLLLAVPGACCSRQQFSLRTCVHINKRCEYCVHSIF
jgi:hypothetical protein